MTVKKHIITRIPVADLDTARALEEHARAIRDATEDAMLRRRTVVVTLPNATAVTTLHKLGRAFESYSLSAPIGATAAGYIKETAGNRSTSVILTATGYGATITVAMTVW